MSGGGGPSSSRKGFSMTRHFESVDNMTAHDLRPLVNRLGEEVYINEFLYYFNVPKTHRDLVCFPGRCEGIDTIDGYRKKRGDVVYKHNNCNRPHFSTLYRCGECTTVFTKDFVDPRFCFCTPRCWDCLSLLSATFYCSSHPKSDRDSRSPEGLNPKTYSTSDLNDFLSEMGLDIEI